MSSKGRTMGRKSQTRDQNSVLIYSSDYGYKSNSTRFMVQWTNRTSECQKIAVEFQGWIARSYFFIVTETFIKVEFARFEAKYSTPTFAYIPVATGAIGKEVQECFTRIILYPFWRRSGVLERLFTLKGDLVWRVVPAGAMRVIQIRWISSTPKCSCNLITIAEVREEITSEDMRCAVNLLALPDKFTSCTICPRETCLTITSIPKVTGRRFDADLSNLHLLPSSFEMQTIELLFHS